MGRVTVVAIEDFAYHDTLIYTGQAVEMEAIDAAVAARKMQVSLDPQRRPTYQTRDLTAVTATPVAVLSAPPVTTPKKPIRRRARKKA